MLDLLKEITHTHTTTIIHSTIQKYNHQRNGVHEVDLYQEIKRRHPALLILIARPKFKDKNTSILIKKAQQLLKQEIKYSTSDALCSIFSLWTNLDNWKLNCWDFINEVFLEHPEYYQVKNCGIPSKLLESNLFEPIYLTNF